MLDYTGCSLCFRNCERDADWWRSCGLQEVSGNDFRVFLCDWHHQIYFLWTSNSSWQGWPMGKNFCTFGTLSHHLFYHLQLPNFSCIPSGFIHRLWISSYGSASLSSGRVSLCLCCCDHHIRVLFSSFCMWLWPQNPAIWICFLFIFVIQCVIYGLNCPSDGFVFFSFYWVSIFWNCQIAGWLTFWSSYYASCCSIFFLEHCNQILSYENSNVFSSLLSILVYTYSVWFLIFVANVNVQNCPTILTYAKIAHWVISNLIHI